MWSTSTGITSNNVQILFCLSYKKLLQQYDKCLYNFLFKMRYLAFFCNTLTWPVTFFQLKGLCTRCYQGHPRRGEVKQKSRWLLPVHDWTTSHFYMWWNKKGWASVMPSWLLHGPLGWELKVQTARMKPIYTVLKINSI